MTAIASPPERKSDKIDSPLIWRRVRNVSMASAAAMDVSTAVAMGLSPASTPSATPASETCASVSAMSEYRRTTKNIPMHGATIAIKMPAINACCIN